MLDGPLAIIRVVSIDVGDASPKRLPMAASKPLSSSGSVSGIGWLRLLFVPARGALEKKSSMTVLVYYCLGMAENRRVDREKQEVDDRNDEKGCVA